MLDASSDDVVASLDDEALDDAFRLVDSEETGGTIGPSQSAMVFLHLRFGDPEAVPATLLHTISVDMTDAPPVDETVAEVTVDDRAVLELGPPLKGTRYLAADGCCDSTRHRRATLPINGTSSIAQRYAIDWEQVDADGRIHVGDSTDPDSYAIYGDQALAVGDGTVVKVVDGLPEQVPGTFPEDIDVEDADGNAVILDLGDGNFVMYAHLQPGSPTVEVGDTVSRGDVVGLVGNSGNSVAPHLHLQLMTTPLSLASSGLPYTIDRFTVSGVTVSTAAFDAAEADGIALEFDPVDPPAEQRGVYPMDQSLVDFD